MPLVDLGLHSIVTNLPCFIRLKRVNEKFHRKFTSASIKSKATCPVMFICSTIYNAIRKFREISEKILAVNSHRVDIILDALVLDTFEEDAAAAVNGIDHGVYTEGLDFS